MTIAQSNSPSGEIQHLFPSPTSSDSTSSLLYTPDDVMANHKQEFSDRLQLHQASISAANAAFASATKREDSGMIVHRSNDSSFMFAHDVSGAMDTDMSGDTSSLAEALDFNCMSAEMQAAFGHHDTSSFADQRPATSHPTADAFGGSMLRIRVESSSGRRHSIQPLMPATDSTNSSWNDYASLAGPNVGARSMSLSVDPFDPYSYHAAAAHHNMMGDMSAGSHDMSGTAFLMSPPRLTVSMSSSNSPTPTPFGGAMEDAKRRRTSEVDATPERAVEHLAQYQHGSMPQQTPPNMYAYQQHPQFSVESSVGAGLETPASVQSNVSPCRARRLSLTAVDQANHLASLTANLTLPAFNGELQPPKSAPAGAGSDAMQRAQSQSRGVRRGSADANKSTTAKRNNSVSGNATPSGNVGNGKNQDVWPDDVEVAFWEALRLIPKLGRRKVLVHGKPCGRNELIADYIERKTDKKRSRKQVSSHIQVLKNIRKSDPEFQQLIAEPVREEDFYIPAGGMMYAHMLTAYGLGNVGGALPFLNVDTASSGLLSPYTPGLTGGQGLASPLSPGAPPLSATHAITSGLNELRVKDNGIQKPCPILPASFSMWTHCSDGDEKHVYTNLDRNSMTVFANKQATLPLMMFDAVPTGHVRFPRLVEMYQRMPCQFLHVRVPLSIPRHDVMIPRYDSFSTQLSFTSEQDQRLISVTTVYSHGKRVLNLVEPLPPPRKISGRNGIEVSSAVDTAMSGSADQGASSQHDASSSTPVKSKSNTQRRESDGSLGSLSPTSNTSSGPASPRTPLDANNQSSGSHRHRWCHQAPFATEFWGSFLSRSHPVHVHNGVNGLESFAKEPSERAALGMAMSGVTIIQELVVAGDSAAASVATTGRDDASALPNDAAASISPGSKIGTVVLVIAWDLECVESLGTNPGSPTVSLLTVGSGASPLSRVAPLASPLHPHPALAGLQLNAQGLSPMTAAFPHHGAAPYGQHQAHHPFMTGAPAHGGLAHSQAPPSLVHTQPSPQPSFSFKADLPQAGSNTNVQTPTLLRKRGMSMNKPNLSVSIPPAPQYLNPHRAVNGAMLSPHPQLSPAMSPTPAQWGMMQQRAVHTPVTPFPQTGAGLFGPPPLNTGDDARAQKERLERHWANQTNPLGGALPSPLDMSFNHADVHSGNATSMSSAGMAVAAAVAGHGDSALGLTVPGAHGGLPLLSPAGFDMGSKTSQHAGIDSANSSFEQMLNDPADLTTDASTREYLDGLLASIGVEGQSFGTAA